MLSWFILGLPLLKDSVVGLADRAIVGQSGLLETGDVNILMSTLSDLSKPWTHGRNVPTCNVNRNIHILLSVPGVGHWLA